VGDLVSGISIAKSLELTLLGPVTTVDDVRAGCSLAVDANLAAVCVWPAHVRTAAEALVGSATRACAAIAFPYGHDTVEAKLFAIDRAVRDGASELAVLLDPSPLVAGRVDLALEEVERVCSRVSISQLQTTRGRSELTLVLETTLLDCTRLEPLWQAMGEGPVGFLQTSSGHQTRAVTDDHVRSLRDLLPDDVAIKAVGGIHSLADASSLLTSGAVRVGAASAVAIAQQERHERQVNAPR
jgi:deoxyribose-phosphate aldolase